MFILRKITIGLLSLIVLILIGVFGYLYYLLPCYDGERKIAGIKNEVKILYDEFAVPHIFNTCNLDAFIALGYAHAQDRLFQMELLRRVGGGRLSEIFGKDLVKVDKLFRALGIAKVAKKSAGDYFKDQSQSYQQLTLAYLQGINNYIENGKTPIEFTLLGIKKEKFTVEDVYLISGYMAFSFAEAFRTDPILTSIKNKLGENYLSDILISDSLRFTTLPNNVDDSTANLSEKILSSLSDILCKNPAPTFIGSNAWVVGPKKSESGKVLFCNDTHIGYAAPCVWYEAHLQTPTDTLYGNFLAGFPFPLVGHTRHHSWGLTMFENDDINLYQEKLNNEKPNQYWHNNKWLPLESRKEIIKIKNEEPVSFEVRSTHHGAIINNIVEEVDSTFTNPISVYWTYNHFPATTIQAAWQMAFAKNIKEMQSGASLINAPGLNIVYGDAEGNIAWWAAAKLLEYHKNVNTKLILDGTLVEHDPTDTIPFEENPHSINPACNYIFSANNYPHTEEKKYIPGYYAPPDRAIEINTFLQSKNKFSIEDLKKLQASSTSSSKKQIAQIIVLALKQKSNSFSQLQKDAIKNLENWNGNHDADSITPSIFYTTLSFIMQLTMQDEIGSSSYSKLVNTHTLKESQIKLLNHPNSVWWDNIDTKEKETQSQIIFNSFVKAVEVLKTKSENEIAKWNWKNYHTLEHIHALGQQKPLDKIFNVNMKGINGGNETVNNAGFNLDTSASFYTKYGPAMRIAIDFYKIDSGYSCLPTGQSGYFFSKHYSDQSQMYAQNNYRRMLMNLNTIGQENKNLLILKPYFN